MFEKFLTHTFLAWIKVDNASEMLAQCQSIVSINSSYNYYSYLENSIFFFLEIEEVSSGSKGM